METLIMAGIVVLYTLLAMICLFSLYKVFMGVSEMIRELLEEIKEENWENGSEEKEETEAEKGSASDTEE